MIKNFWAIFRTTGWFESSDHISFLNKSVIIGQIKVKLDIHIRKCSHNLQYEQRLFCVEAGYVRYLYYQKFFQKKFLIFEGLDMCCGEK